MAKKNLNGQLSMFDFFRNLENDVPLDGEVEMVSLMPDDIAVEEEEARTDEAAEPEKMAELKKAAEPEKMAELKKAAEQQNGDIAMKYEVKTSDGNIRDAVYYLNYNTVVIIENGIKRKQKFDNSKEAVECYIEYVLRKKKSK